MGMTPTSLARGQQVNALQLSLQLAVDTITGR